MEGGIPVNSYNGFTPSQRMKALKWLKAQDREPVEVCDACGSKANVNPHSEDYSEPFGDHIGAFALCYACHMMVHCRFKNRDLWVIYRRGIRLARRLQDPPVTWPVFRSKILARQDVQWQKSPGVRERVLDAIEEGTW